MQSLNLCSLIASAVLSAALFTHAAKLLAPKSPLPPNHVAPLVSRLGGLCSLGSSLAAQPSCVTGLVCRVDRSRSDNVGICSEPTRELNGLPSTEGESCGGVVAPVKQCATGLVCRVGAQVTSDSTGKCTKISAMRPVTPVQSPLPRANDVAKEQPSEICPPNQKLSLVSGKCTSLNSIPAQENEECGGPFSDARQCATGLICQFQIPTPPDATGRCKLPPAQVFSKEGEECGESFFLANQCAAGLVCKYDEGEFINVYGRCVRTS
ncbi:hypothetical protein BDF19DRAFT_463985 [Syncephalis fuscata]|nr:hypothetical protein BDF19DRAFT_463985 [Syncephalis fuscata]